MRGTDAEVGSVNIRFEASDVFDLPLRQKRLRLRHRPARPSGTSVRSPRAHPQLRQRRLKGIHTKRESSSSG